jgi:hypothetical protein
MADVETYPECYLKTGPTWFNWVWDKWHGKVRLRKWLRFSKCVTCEKQRKIKFNRHASVEQKQDATKTLISHYKWVKAERAYAHTKKIRAIQCPTEILSIAIDGTDQLPNGLPQFRQATSADGPAHHRLHVKFTLARTHNLRQTTAYAHLENIAGDPNLTIEVIQRQLKEVRCFFYFIE